METLKKRVEFLAAAAAAKAPEPGFVLQAHRRDDDGPPRVGFTVSRKIGTAVERNRVRRRLRALVRRAPEGRMRPGHDYVLVGRRAALTLMFTRLMHDLVNALDDVHEREEAPRRERRRRPPAPAGARGKRDR